MVFSVDQERLLLNIRKAATDDLLDRLAVYASELEPDVLPMIEKELLDRGVTAAHIEDYRREMEPKVLRRADGSVEKCSFCRRPAQARGWGWHKIGRVVPVFPRRFAYCAKHRASMTESA